MFAGDATRRIIVQRPAISARRPVLKARAVTRRRKKARFRGAHYGRCTRRAEKAALFRVPDRAGRISIARHVADRDGFFRRAPIVQDRIGVN